MWYDSRKEDAALARGELDPDDDQALFEQLVQQSHILAQRGIFNALISNGRWLFAYAGTRLHRLTRRAPFQKATLADDDLSVDFARLTTAGDVVTILSTEPLTLDEQWIPLQVGEALLLQRGDIIAYRVPDIPDPASCDSAVTALKS